MKPRTKALVAAGSGIAVGVGGLLATTIPAGADEDPVLPEISAEDLVASVMEAEPPAFSGTAELENDLGLTMMPGAEVLDFETARVFHDGDEGARVQVERSGSELTLVKNAAEAWAYDSQENSATHFTWDEADEALQDERARVTDPSQGAAELIDLLRPTSEIAVDGTARVADRDAYELVLSPKPSEKTLLREVTVAVDSETRIPLRIEISANGTSDPVLSLGFVEFDTGEQDADLFAFTPPSGAEVTTPQEGDLPEGDGEGEHDAELDELAQSMTVVGDGWDTVFVGEAPADGPTESMQDVTPQEQEALDGMLGNFASRVSGEFGSGWHMEFAVGGAVITDDGQIAVGAVPEQVLVDALENQ